MLRADFAVPARWKPNSTPLHIAAARGSTTMVKHMLQAFVSPPPVLVHGCQAGCQYLQASESCCVCPGFEWYRSEVGDLGIRDEAHREALTFISNPIFAFPRPRRRSRWRGSRQRRTCG